MSNITKSRHALEKIKMSAFTDIPVIDIGCLRNDDSEGHGAVATQINTALTEVGFMYVTNHGIDQRIFDDAIETGTD